MPRELVILIEELCRCNKRGEAVPSDVQRYVAMVLRHERTNDNLRFLWHGVLAYQRARPGLFAWLERAQLRCNAYGPDGVARVRDLDEFEAASKLGFRYDSWMSTFPVTYES